MLRPRVIPCLLLKGEGLYKGSKFRDHRYIGDPINAVQIFNTKESDEILFLDISATAEGRITSPETIQRIADQCLIPFAVGGGIRSIEDAKKILSSGAEKVCLNTAALENPSLIRQIADTFGSQSIVVSIDVKKSFLGGYGVYTRCGSRKISGKLTETAQQVEAQGAGEILLNNIDLDGTRQGFDLGLIQTIVDSVSIPVIAAGGAGSYSDLRQALVQAKADAVAAGSLFVFHGRRQAVLISYPSPEEHKEITST
jgi:cyclase